MKYLKTKPQSAVYAEIEAGDVLEWANEKTGSRIKFVVTTVKEDSMEGLTFFDTRNLGAKTPHHVSFTSGRFAYRLRKLKLEEWA